MSGRRQWTFVDTLNLGFTLRGYEEDDDVVIMVIHKSDKSSNIVRFDQGSHTFYHSHINGRRYEEFPRAVSKEQKINISINEMKKYISSGLVKHEDVVYIPADNISDILEKYKQDMLAKIIDKGTIQGCALIRATAAIITFDATSPNVEVK